MESKYTKRHVARGSRADAERNNELYLMKSSSTLRATYQIRLLLYRAQQQQRRLVLLINKNCEIQEDLRALMKEHKRHIVLERR